MTARFRKWVHRHELIAFFFVSFLFSWFVFGALYGVIGSERIGSSRYWHVPFAWGPLIGGGLVTWLAGGSVREWGRQAIRWDVDPRWYVAAVGLPLILTNTDQLVVALAGVSLSLTAPVDELLVDFLITFFLAGALEEFGWRGFAQPRLQERYGALVGAVIVGCAWGLWHYPWIVLGGEGYQESFLVFVIFTVVASVILAGLYNGTRGALPIVMLTHALINVMPFFEVAGEFPAWMPAVQFGALIWLLIALFMALAHWGGWLVELGGATPDPPVPGRREHGME